MAGFILCIVPWEVLMMGRAWSQTRCLPPAHYWCCRLVCMVIFSCLQGRSDFGVLLAPVRASCTMPDLWHLFQWALTKGLLDKVGLKENVGVGHSV